MYTEDLVYGVGETWIQKPTIVDVDGIKYHKWNQISQMWMESNIIPFCLSWCEPNNHFAAFNMQINYLNFLLRVKLMKSKQIVQTTSGRKKINKQSQMNGSMNRWTHEWMDGWMDG